MMAPKAKPKSKPSMYLEPYAVGVNIHDSWFAGTVSSHVPNVRLRVTVHNRGQPLPASLGKLKSGEQVLLFHRGDRRWDGSVTKVLRNGRFRVSLVPRHSKEEMESIELVLPEALLRTQVSGKDEKDSISELPDKVLLHIMSFVDTKSAVRTCAVSKRWKGLCKCLTSLSFTPTPYRYYPNFGKFVSWVISSRDHSYSLLSLAIDYYRCDIDAEFVDRVISYAMLHNVQQLKVDIFLRVHDTQFLPEIFCCQSLKSLELSIKLDPLMLIIPKCLYMPALTTLQLSFVRFTAYDNEYAEPFSNCPVLNTLTLRHCSLHNDKQLLRISNPTLSTLTIYEGQTLQIELSTPNLSSFTIKGSVHHQLFSTCNFSFLREVNIFIYGDEKSWDENSSVIIKWLQVLANVKILTLSMRAFRIILRDLSNPSSMRPQPPCFGRLESLKVKRQFFANIYDEEVNRVLEYLLQNSPMASVDVLTNA